MLTNVAKRRVNTTILWINAVCTEHAERCVACGYETKRLVVFMYTKTNLLLTKGVVALDLVDDVDYDRAILSFPNFEVHPCCCLPLSSSVVVAVLLMNG